MKKVLIFLIAVLGLLFGCASEPGVKVITQEVKVPIREVCVKKENMPRREDFITVKPLKKDSNVLKTKKLIVHYGQSEMYIKTLEEILKSCSN